MYVLLKLLLQTPIQKCFVEVGMENKLHEFRLKIHINQSYPSFFKHAARFLPHLSYSEFRVSEYTLTQAGFTNQISSTSSNN